MKMKKYIVGIAICLLVLFLVGYIVFTFREVGAGLR